jgi:hypothetical protein
MDTPEHDCGSSDVDRRTTPAADSAFVGAAGTSADFVHTSRLAVVACILGVVSLLLVPGLVAATARKGGPVWVRSAYQYAVYGTSISAAVLGLISMARIGRSAGRLAGRGFAVIGVTAPVTQWLVFFALVLVRGPTDYFIGMSCGTNLSSVGKAMLIYANDYEDELPRAGGPHSRWTGRIPDWQAPNRHSAYGMDSLYRGGQVSISASLYLLVKYAEARPKSFICGYRETGVFDGYRWPVWTNEAVEEGITEFRPDTYPTRGKAELIDFWDFGPDPMRHVSYAYHMPYGLYALATSYRPDMPVAADRNPWIDTPSTKARDFSKFKPEIAGHGGTQDQARCGNAVSHQREGQNVLFLDSHVAFEKRPYCGVDDDNIYTVSARPPEADPWGTPPNLGSQPACRKDALLVNDPLPAQR